MDKIKIKDLELYCHHGVFEEEKQLGQRFVVSLEMELDTRMAGKSDDLDKSIHYGDVCHFVKAFMEESTYRLIEAVAEHLAEALLLKWTEIKKLSLKIKKPWAPIGLPLDTVAVEIKRQWHSVYIAIGSNIGNRHEYLQAAVRALADRQDCLVIKVSEFINTVPYGMMEQADFLNGVLLLQTLQTPQELLATIKQIEVNEGRTKETRWGPRTLDLDIIFYDNQIIDSEELQIPHIDMQNRYFVLEPMQQIAPYKRHPILNKTITELKGELDDRLTRATR